MPKTVRIVLAAAVCLLLFLGAAASAQVPDPFARQLARQLAHAEQLLRDEGYSRAAGPFAGGLVQRQSRTFPVTLRAGQDYRFVGVCDSNCHDLDMRLYDANNDLVAEDAMTDDVPVLHVVPRATGVHSVVVSMYRCAGPNCYFAFNVYSK
ncbi:MAG TPA: hypothetical protein VG841_00160 [Caulobacterales bacterium]|nr:hypothetical protein [Caulobacterales bacterium]